MLTLYYCPFTRANRPRWTLEELGVPYQLEVIDLKKGEHRSPEYLKINPLGLIPALDDDGQVIVESGAICLYLADKFPEKGLGPTPEDRGHYYQWSFFLFGTLEPPLMDYFHHTTLYKPEDRSAFVAQKGKQGIAKALDFLEANLAGRRFLLGDRFTVPDIMLGSALIWIASLNLMNGRERLLRYVSEIRQRPAFQRANAD